MVHCTYSVPSQAKSFVEWQRKEAPTLLHQDSSRYTHREMSTVTAVLAKARLVHPVKRDFRAHGTVSRALPHLGLWERCSDEALIDLKSDLPEGQGWSCITSLFSIHFSCHCAKFCLRTNLGILLWDKLVGKLTRSGNRGA